MPATGSPIAEIQAKVDLLAYVSQYVTLRKRGREYVGLCPFHAEKTPSFSLNAEKQVWHCYGCNAGGDLVSFVKRYENVEFGDAIRLLAARAGVQLREPPGARRQRSEREAIYEANGVARTYFAGMLARSPDAAAYVRQRGLGTATCEKFGIGFAPEAWDGLVCSLSEARVDLQIALRAGLVSLRQGEAAYVDFFRRRLMFPIFNLTGEVIAFGGRSLGDEQPKYLNTKNTAAYTKGQHVYGLHVARRAAAAKEALIVVEGYMDCLALQQAGFANTVASLGTAFTVEQARELRRVASNLYLCFDGDAAGQAATARSIDMLAEEGMLVRVARLPSGCDPDDLVRDQGAEAFAALLDGSQPWVDFKIELACARIAAQFVNRADVAREAMSIITRVRDPIERDQYVKRMSRRLDIDESALRALRPLVAVPPRINGFAEPVRAQPPAAVLSVEREFVALLLSQPRLLDAARVSITPADLEDPALTHCYELLIEHAGEIAAGLNPLSVVAQQPAIAELTHLALSSPPLDADEEEHRLGRIAARFERRRLERRLCTVDAEMNKLLTAGESVPEPLRDEYNALAATLRGASADRKEARP